MNRLANLTRTITRQAPFTASLLKSQSQVPRLSPTLMPFRFYSAAPSHPDRDTIRERILQILKDFDKVDPTKLSPSSHFVNDLGLDSLDQVEITMAIEEEFNIEIPDKDAEEIMTVDGAVDKVYADKASI